MLPDLARNWWVLLVRGLIAIAFGVLAFAWPGLTLLTLVLLYAAYALLDGVTALVLGFSGHSGGVSWWGMILVGVLGILTAVVTVVWPGITALVLLALIAGSAIVRGIFEIAAAIHLRKVINNEWMLILAGALSIAFGIALVVWPAEGLLALVWLIGAYACVAGAVLIVVSLQLRELGSRQAPLMPGI